MNKKVVAGILIIAAIILIIAAILYSTAPKPAVFSDDPKDWVVKDGKNRTIDVIEATKGASRIDVNGQQYETAAIGTVFELEGWYQGNYFKDAYDANGKTVMRISPSMIPGDGIMEGFVMARIENDAPYLYIFLDSDWKSAIPNTGVYWGKRYQNKSPFDFSKEVSPGVYLNRIPDDPARFEPGYSAHWGGAWIGDLRDDDKSTIISLN
jgi:hypothetical protein